MTQHWISSFLLSQNLINNDDLEQAIDEIDNSNEQLITNLINNKLLDANAFAIESSQFFNLPLFDLNAYDLDFFPHAFLD